LPVISRALVLGAVLTMLWGDAIAQRKTAFQLCVAEALPRLDDHISSADVIAAGVVEECRDGLRKNEPAMRAETFEMTIRELKQRIVPEVLKYRTAHR
jgi:hypothetical protein